MQQRFLGVSPLETIGELPEDGSMSDRDVPKQCSRIGIHMPLGIDHSSYQDNSGIMNHDRDTDVINKVINSNSAGEMQLADDVSTNVESVIDSVSSLSTFTSSLRHDLMSSPSSSRQDLTHSPSSSRQDLSPSPSCSFGSEESISDDSGTFQIQTFSLDDITHSGHQETIRNSQSNIGNSHLVFHTSVDSMTANNSLLPYTPAGGKTTMQGDDQCVHIEVFKSPPIKPTPVRKSVQKMRQRRRSKPKLIEIPEEKNDNVVDETHTTVMPLKSELVDEKNAADMLEIKKENDQIIAEFSSKSEESVKSPSCVEVCVNVSAMEKETSNDCYETVQKYNPSNCSERLTQAKLVPSPREQHMPSIAHQFVTEEHELVQDISPIIPSLPGAAAVTEKKNGTMTPENYRESGEHDIAKSEAESSHSKITNSTRKTGSFKTAMNSLKTLVKAENYLPQCSHYSSHERALKKAGYNLKDLDADIAAQAESNKEQKSGRKSTAVEPKFAWSSPSRKKPPSRRKSIFGRKQSAEISRDEYERILDGRRESYGMVNRSNKKKLKHAKEKSAIERKQNMKNAKRIANYLKLIKKHPQQYLDLKKSAMVSVAKKWILMITCNTSIIRLH